MNAGPFAGKTVSMGIDGLRYDLTVLQARVREGGLKAAERGDLHKRIAELQTLAREYEARQVRSGFTPKAERRSTFSCFSYDRQSDRYVSYFGVAEVKVNGGLYLDRGDGSFNWYYARMNAIGLVNVYPPAGLWFPFVSTNASASVRNALTGQTVTASPLYAQYSAGAGTGWVYSGPSFGHNLSGTATASAGGDCWGYLSVSDSFVL